MKILISESQLKVIIEQQNSNLTAPEQTLLGFLNRFLKGEPNEFQNTPIDQLRKTLLFNSKTIYPMVQKLIEKKDTGKKTYDDKTFNALFMSMDKVITKEQRYEFFKDGGSLTNVSYGSVQEQGWTDPVKAASGPQKCGITKGDNGSYDKESRILDKESARQDKIDAKERAQQNKNFMSLSYDRDGDPLDKQTRKQYYSQYQDFMKNNPGVLNSSDGFTSEQKYAIVSKVLDFVRKVPQISYTVRLKGKYGITPKSSLNDLVEVVNKMGGWTSFMDWFNGGGREIKEESELTERCWKGYTQKGMKTMFGKRYPNCVKIK